MNECIHGLDSEQCGQCSPPVRGDHHDGTSMAGKTFALVFIPSVRENTFVHLNREGDSWKLRQYVSPHRPAVVLAQSGKASTRAELELADVEIVREVSYPYSTSPGGVRVTDSRYWFDEIDRLNSAHHIGSPSADGQAG